MDVAARIADYKKRADEARKEAMRMTSAAAKAGLLSVAADWEQLAEDILNSTAAEMRSPSSR
jgi:hypothetical protein